MSNPPRKIRVAFIVNMRSTSDLCLVIPPLRRWKQSKPRLYRFAVSVLRFFILWIAPLLGVSSWMRSKDNFRGVVDFYVPVVMMIADQMKVHPTLTMYRVQMAALWAVVRYKADVIVLGAYTSPLTHDGRDVESMFRVLGWGLGWLIPRLRTVIVSHGDSLSASVGAHQLADLADKYGLWNEQLAVIGATGIIGSALTRWFSDKVKSLLVIGRTEKKLEQLGAELRAQGIDPSLAIWKNGHATRFAWAQKQIPEVKFGVLCTSHPGELVTEEHLNPHGSVWGDASQPANLRKEIGETAPIAAIDLSIVSSPHFPVCFGGFKMGNPPHCLYACGGEALTIGYTLAVNPLMARKLRSMRLTGEISLENMAILIKLAREAEIFPAAPSWSGQFIELPPDVPSTPRPFHVLDSPTPQQLEAHHPAAVASQQAVG
ncbi:hypothetical protein KKC88_00260 [Patescibacteria group bacterium]|nr:hypothetical protein [Patescibacteria group bacterium]MBU1673431.1 hypothetical protein [Patescibacteria group bacterium]MBU1963368.1 hypothetical protein [Patescibacteria group bacterium]